MNPTVIAPSVKLHLKVRSGFVLQGTTLASWCREHGVHPTNARNCLIGSWDGPKGRELRVQLVKASGITTSTISTAA